MKWRVFEFILIDVKVILNILHFKSFAGREGLHHTTPLATDPSELRSHKCHRAPLHSAGRMVSGLNDSVHALLKLERDSKLCHTFFYCIGKG